MLEIKNTIRKMKNVFDGLISRLDTAEEAASEFEENGGYMSLYIVKTHRIYNTSSEPYILWSSVNNNVSTLAHNL